jgi:uncharacterized protein (TIGR00297 family)
VWYAVGVAAAAWLARLLTPGGAIAAATIGGVIWEKGGLAYAAPLLVFFISGSLLGRLPGGGAKEGPRRTAQVVANGGAAALAALVPNGETAFVAALCAANADTWATEVGTRFGGRPFRITNLRPADIGASGAVSGAGMLAAAAGAVVVAVSAIPLSAAAVGFAAIAGFFGSVVDSVLGDTVQARFWSEDLGENEAGGQRMRGWRWLRNDQVNLAMTLFAAALAYGYQVLY